MPAPTRTSAARIQAAARTLLEAGGPEAVTMHAIARAEGIRAPSLYKHVPDRAALLEQLVVDGFIDLALALQEAAGAPAPLFALAHAHRDFARAAPGRYRLMFSSQAATTPAADAARRTAATPLLDHLRPLVGAERALAVARLFTAYVHGYLTLELAGAFRLGGDPEREFDEGIGMLQRVVERGGLPEEE